MIFSFFSFLFDITYLQSSTLIHFSFHFASSAYSFRSNQHNYTLLAPHTLTWSNPRLLICVSKPMMLLLMIPDYKHKNRIPKIIFFYPFPPLLYLVSLPSSFRISPPFLSLPLPYFSTLIPHVLNCLSLLTAHSAPSFLSFHSIPVFSLLDPTSKSPHHFSFCYTLSPQVLRNFLIHLSDFLLYLDSLMLSLLSYLSVSLSISLSSTFIYLPFALNLSASSLAYPFLL
jgi:hypothetical protein